jgi:zinc D-Ala-D-Ala dipeptidase
VVTGSIFLGSVSIGLPLVTVSDRSEPLWLISDPHVLAIPIADVGEPLVDVRELRGIRIDSRRRDNDGAYAQVRFEVGRRLLRAQASLPGGFCLLFVEGYRPLERQRLYFDRYLAALRKRHPRLPSERLREEAAKYVAPPEAVPPHSTGGAVDLTIASASGAECDMGTAVNASPLETNGACFTASADISSTARANRDLLISAMTTAGFVNYETEWWHWSFGDRYWAHMCAQPAALYGAIAFTPSRSM